MNDSILLMYVDALLKAPLGTLRPISILKSRNTSQQASGLTYSHGYFDSFGVPKGMMELRDLFVNDEVSMPNGGRITYSFPVQEHIKERVFDTFEPITAAGRPEWAVAGTHYFKFRSKDNPACVPETFLKTWFEGRWSGRVNTKTFPVTISLWFENPDDVVLAKLAGLPISEKHVVLSET